MKWLSRKVNSESTGKVATVPYLAGFSASFGSDNFCTLDASALISLFIAVSVNGDAIFERIITLALAAASINTVKRWNSRKRLRI